MSNGPPNRAVVLLSGGVDSATTAALAREQGFAVHALTVRYGQRHAVEVDRAVELARLLGATAHRILDCDLGFLPGSALVDRNIAVPGAREREAAEDQIPCTYVPARNTVFLALALAWAESIGARDLFIGANVVDYSGYPDCRPEFLHAFERLANLGTRRGVEAGDVRVHAPLLRWNKARIILEATRLGVDLGRTTSCYAPSSSGRPCGRCEACALRARGFDEAGLADPAMT